MKTLTAVVMFLVLVLGGLGYVEYQQRLQITDLQIQVSTLQGDVNIQHIALASQKKAIVRIRTDDQGMERVLVKIVEFLNQIEVESAPSKPGSSS